MKRYYISLESMILWQATERPVRWENIFGRTAPLEMEIGFGNGEYLVERAAAYPERDFVGIELVWDSVRRGLRRVAKSGVRNVRLLQADAVTVLACLVTPGSFESIYTLFPCPWPKDKHVANRIFGNHFLRLVNNRLTPDGEARIVTDSEPYLEWVVEQIPGSGFEQKKRVVPPGFNTKYETKWRAAGQQEFYELKLRKSEVISLPAVEDADLKIHLVEQFKPEGFDPEGVRGDVVVEFKEKIYDPERGMMMIRAIIVEDDLQQNLWIRIARKGDRWKITPAPGCGMIPTVGVQKALDRLAEEATSP